MKNLKTAFVLLFALAVVSLSGSVGAAGGGNSGGLDPQTAAKISGIEQLVADYVQDVDWGPLSDAPNGINDTETIGNLFTPTGNFAVGYWNSGNPVPLSWHPASGPSYDQCNNVGPAAVARFFGGPGSFPRTSTVGHHVITNLQITVDKDGDTGIVRGTQTITFGTVNSAGNGGTASVVLTGRYYGLVRLTPQGWKFDLWEPIEDQPGEIPGCLANNQNP
jgi:SnoaL-like protein